RDRRGRSPGCRTWRPTSGRRRVLPARVPGLWSTLDEEMKDRYRANGQMMLAEFAGPPYQLTTDDVAQIEVPALVIAGTASHPALCAFAAALVRALPDARFVELTGAGHVTYAEQPDQFAKAVRAVATERQFANQVLTG